MIPAGKPVRQAVAIVLWEGASPPEAASPCVLAVHRPVDDEDLPGVWGLPAASVRTGESPEDAVLRVGRDKLGVGLRVGRLMAEGETARAGYHLHMRLYQAQITRGEPRVPQPVTGVTQYDAWRWALPDELGPGAAAGSLCCRLYLAAVTR